MAIFNLRWIVLVGTCTIGTMALAQPEIVYRYSTSADLKSVGVNAIVSLEKAYTEAGSNCDQRIADLKIDDVVYDGASDIVIGFRATKPGKNGNEWYGLFSMDTEELYKHLANAERRSVNQLIRPGANVIVIYQICGSGGFASVRDIFAKAAINNP